ncbi:potassium/proton antiporter [Spiribacter vilamensis]|uniref:Potassium/proton antiporter (CPA1 family) n=1 Tax=Spiribacter vilamensis TaxID=531306 RepID=A0A4Q8D045_9GAMM|nr:potassium/proton antiporter [Spiribacter vilamensis]RZU98681.1 potassium/proton antiporter (CPA1 family) [Spiribacter vilamensis]TVO62293.1 potassium/proton antiporter [Spiribacter vilamensis]
MLEWLPPLVLIGSSLVLVSVLTSVLAFRIGAPLLLFFLAIGLIAGEDGLGVVYNDWSGAYLIGSMALAIILFDAGFGTKLRYFKKAAAPALTLATLGVLITTGFVGVAAHVLFGLPWTHALLLGAIVSSTDAAAVFYLLRVGGITLRERVRATLSVESGSNDPIAIFLVTALVELIRAQSALGELTFEVLTGFGLQMGGGIGVGLVGGWLLVRLMNTIDLEAALYPILVLAAALLLFGAASQFGGSGFVAVYVAGLVAGNHAVPHRTALRRFQDGTTWLAQILMFLVLGLLATPSDFPAVILPAMGLALFLMFVARPIAVGICLLPFRFSPKETAFIGWVGLRGAVSILLAILPFLGGIENAQRFFNVAFIMVLTSLLVQGWTIKPVAQRLGLIVPRRLGPVEKIELELPGTAHHELVVYHVMPESPIVGGARLPRWARPALVLRDGRSMHFRKAGYLQPDDYIYIFMSPQYAAALDHLFAGSPRQEVSARKFFGDFAIATDAPMKALIDVYGVKLPPTATKVETTSVGAYLQSRLKRPEPGDRVRLGSVVLIVRAIDDRNRITAIGLSFD